MAGKKISELNEITNPTDADEFVFVDKEGTGSDSGTGGKSAKITFANLKSAIGATNGQKGEPGEKGDKGDLGPQGSPGEGADSYWSTGSVADTIGYTGSVGVGTIDPIQSLHTTGDIQMENDTAIWTTHSNGTRYRMLQNYSDNATYLDNVHGGIIFRTGLTNSPERMRIDAETGNVGIGTDSPVAKLHIKSSGTSSSGIYIQNSLEKGLLNIFEDTQGNGVLLLGDKDGWDDTTTHPKIRLSTLYPSLFSTGIGLGVERDEEITALTGGSNGYKLVVSDDTSTGTSIMLHNSYSDDTHSPQTWRFHADPDKKVLQFGEQGTFFKPRLKLHSSDLGGFTFGDDGNGAKENFSTIRFPSSGVYPSLDLIRNEVINELTSKNYPGSGTVIQFGALKNDLDENYDPIPGTRGPQAGVRVSGGLYPARNAREDAPKNDRYPGNYGEFDVGVLESSTGSMVNRLKITEHGRAEFHSHQNGGNQKTYSSIDFAPHYGIQIRNMGDPDQAKFSGIGFQSSGRTGGYATGWIGVVNGVGGQPTGDMVFGTRMADGTDNAYGERMRLTQDGDLYIGPKGSTNALKTNKMYYIKCAPYTWTGNDKVSDDTVAIGLGPVEGTGSDDGNIVFKTATNVNTGGQLEQRMRIHQNGHVSINGNLSVGDKSNNAYDKSHFDINAEHNYVASRTWSFSTPSSMGSHPIDGYHFFTLRFPINADENSWGVMDIDMTLVSIQNTGQVHQVVKSAKIYFNRPTMNGATNGQGFVGVRIDSNGDNFTNEVGTAATVNSFGLSYEVVGAENEVQYVKLKVNTTGDTGTAVRVYGIASFKGSNNVHRS